MDRETGTFHPDDGKLPDDWPRFEIGETLLWKGHKFRVKRIDTDKHEVTLVSERRYSIMDVVAAIQDDEPIKAQLEKLAEMRAVEFCAREDEA